eukprot:scaffold4124_cov267-Chaetoceros_neogracile.AAC.24
MTSQAFFIPGARKILRRGVVVSYLQLKTEGYRALIEPGFNCPQHITSQLRESTAKLQSRRTIMTQANENENRPPLPPFDLESATKKVRLAEDGWNSRDPVRVSQAYTINSRWRNRSDFINGRDQIVEFLSAKWSGEQEYRLIKELWAFAGNRIAVRFAYESQNADGQWVRSYGNENWEFNELGLMTIRHASINDLLISESQRLFRWPLGRRPDDHPSLSALGL